LRGTVGVQAGEFTERMRLAKGLACCVPARNAQLRRNERLTHARLALSLKGKVIDDLILLANGFLGFQCSPLPDSQIFAGALVGITVLALLRRCGGVSHGLVDSLG
jgi:hypothetical protein